MPIILPLALLFASATNIDSGAFAFSIKVCRYGADHQTLIHAIHQVDGGSIVKRRAAAASLFSLQATHHDDHCNELNDDMIVDDITTSNFLLQRRRRFLSNSLLTTATAAATLLVSPPQPSNAAIRDPKTGILLPSIGEIEVSIPQTYSDDDNPLNNSIDALSSSFARLDTTPDTIFYKEPRFVEHVDEACVQRMTNYISNVLLQPNDDSVLDLCSSWTSHIQPATLQLKRVSGLGMNSEELQSNKVLTDWTVMDLNANSDFKLPYDDNSFDKILLQLSIDYLIHPIQVMKECSRILKKDGEIAILFSNRLFLSKAIGLWTGSDDIDHAYTVGSYLYFSEGFRDIKAIDLSTRNKKGMIIGDPLYVVTASKKS